MCFDYDEYAELYEERIVKGRKAHRCQACDGVIDKGERQLLISSLFEGSFSTGRVCRRCCYDMLRVVARELAEGCHWGESWPVPQDLLEYLEESGMGQTPPEQVPSWFDLPLGWPRPLLEALQAAEALPVAAGLVERELYLVPGMPSSPGQQYLFD